MCLIDSCESMQINQKNCVDETCIIGIKIILTKTEKYRPCSGD